jgi:uncharacterized phage protein (TIGR01671 family)
VREIRFRAWDRELKGMISPDLFDDLLDGKEVAWSESRKRKVPSKVTEVPFVDLSSGTHGITHHVEEYEDVTETVRMKSYKGNPFTLRGLDIMQYTGIKDLDGVEIYEGDILARPADNNGTTYDNMAVKWSKYGFHAEGIEHLAKGPHMVHWSQHMFTRFKVIGNIYENPELLRADKGSI